LSKYLIALPLASLNKQNFKKHYRGAKKQRKQDGQPPFYPYPFKQEKGPFLLPVDQRHCF
jgi:hypothetical protein